MCLCAARGRRSVHCEGRQGQEDDGTARPHHQAAKRQAVRPLPRPVGGSSVGGPRHMGAGGPAAGHASQDAAQRLQREAASNNAAAAACRRCQFGGEAEARCGLDECVACTNVTRAVASVESLCTDCVCKENKTVVTFKWNTNTVAPALRLQLACSRTGGSKMRS